MLAGTIIGKEVLDKNANRFGKIVDIDLDLTRGTVSSLVVKIGLTRKILIPVSNIEKVGDRILVNITRSELEKSLTTVK